MKSIDNYEPRVELIDVNVNPDYENNGFNVNIVYEIIGIEIPAQELQFVLQSNR